jgi:hypothetical protein
LEVWPEPVPTNLKGLTALDFSILRHLKNLEKLNMPLTGKHSVDTMKVVGGLSKLQWLNLHGCQHLREEHLQVGEFPFFSLTTSSH